MTHEELEKFVTYLLIINANEPSRPLTEQECKYVEDVKRRVGFRGYRIVSDAVGLAEIRAKHEELTQQIKAIEQDYPQLKDKNT